MRPIYQTTPHKQECTPIIYRSWPWALSELYLLINCIERRLTSEVDKANRTRGVKSAWGCLRRQVGLSKSKVKRGWWVGRWRWSGESCSANTACCHKHTRYMNSHKFVRERGRTRVWEMERKTELTREGKSEGGRPSVYSQCCDMFVMFSHRGNSQTACFHSTVWHLRSTVKM